MAFSAQVPGALELNNRHSQHKSTCVELDNFQDAFLSLRKLQEDFGVWVSWLYNLFHSSLRVFVRNILFLSGSWFVFISLFLSFLWLHVFLNTTLSDLLLCILIEISCFLSHLLYLSFHFTSLGDIKLNVLKLNYIIGEKIEKLVHSERYRVCKRTVHHTR